MSGRAKGARGEREAVKLLRSVELDARGVKRERGASPDVDVVIFTGAGTCLRVQVKRNEDRRVAEWSRAFVRRGDVLMLRRNHEPWRFLFLDADGEVVSRSLTVFASLARLGAMP
jgi:Holliday junction resolvase